MPERKKRSLVALAEEQEPLPRVGNVLTITTWNIPFPTGLHIATITCIRASSQPREFSHHTLEP